MENYIFFSKRRRRFVSFVVLIAGGFFAYRGFTKPVSPRKSFLPPPTAPASKTYLSLLEERGGALAVSADENLTDRVIQEYGSEFIRLNEDKAGKGAEAVSDIQVPEDSFLQRKIEEGLSAPFSLTLFTKDDIRVLSSPSPDAERAYLHSYALISKKNIKNIRDSFLSAVYQKIADGKDAGLQNHIVAAEAVAKDLLQLEVPETLVPLHLALLNMWQKRIVIGAAIQDDSEDPIKGAAALTALSDALEEEERIRLLVSNMFSG